MNKRKMNQDIIKNQVEYKNKAIVAEVMSIKKVAQIYLDGNMAEKAEPTAEDLESTPNLFAKP